MGTLDVSADKLIKNVAEELKKLPEMKPPEWIDFVKSGPHAERLPEQSDFWYIRCASILRTVFLNPGVGVQRLRHKYGGGKAHSVSRVHHMKAGGKIIREALNKLEKAGLVKKDKVGRFITSKGESLLDKSSRS